MLLCGMVVLNVIFRNCFMPFHYEKPLLKQRKAKLERQVIIVDNELDDCMIGEAPK